MISSCFTCCGAKLHVGVILISNFIWHFVLCKKVSKERLEKDLHGIFLVCLIWSWCQFHTEGFLPSAVVWIKSILLFSQCQCNSLSTVLMSFTYLVSFLVCQPHINTSKEQVSDFECNVFSMYFYVSWCFGWTYPLLKVIFSYKYVHVYPSVSSFSFHW